MLLTWTNLRKSVYWLPSTELFCAMGSNSARGEYLHRAKSWEDPHLETFMRN